MEDIETLQKVSPDTKSMSYSPHIYDTYSSNISVNIPYTTWFKVICLSMEFPVSRNRW